VRRDPRVRPLTYTTRTVSAQEYVARVSPRSAAATPTRRMAVFEPPSLRYRAQMFALHVACALIGHPQQRIDVETAWTICPCGRRYYAP
jgi:hypothetical protein